MDEKIIASKEQKRVSLILTIALCMLSTTNILFAFREKWRFSTFVPIVAVACGVTFVLSVLALISLIRNYGKLNEKKRSVITCVGIFVLCGLEISLFVSAVTELNARRNAEKSAVLFIKDKYGIEAEADYDRTSSRTIVKMTAYGKDFTVEQYTDNDGNIKHADDYQLDEIKQAVFDEVSSVYPNGIRRDVRIYGSEFFFHEVIEKYFDGTNLDEVMDRSRGSVTVDFADTEFDLDNPLFKKLDEWSISPYFTSFDTAAHRDEFVASDKLGNYFGYADHYVKYAHSITDRVKYEYGKTGEKGKVIRESYNIETNGEFDYLYVQIEECENGTENLEKFFEKYNESEKVSQPISKAYRNPESIVNSYYIFYPLEKLNGVPAENIGAAWLANSSISNNRGVESASVCGDYAVFALPYRADEFVIVNTATAT